MTDPISQKPHGLPKSELILLPRYKQEAKDADRTISLLVLGLIGIAAAGGAAALIATSGGPTGALLFNGGVALGTFSATELIFTAGFTTRALFQNHRWQHEIVDIEGIFSAMLDARAMQQDVQTVINKLSGESFKEFANHACKSIFPEKHGEVNLTLWDNNILSGLANHNEFHLLDGEKQHLITSSLKD